MITFIETLLWFFGALYLIVLVAVFTNDYFEHMSFMEEMKKLEEKSKPPYCNGR